MLGGAAGVEAKLLLERTDRPFPVPQELEDADARGVPETRKRFAFTSWTGRPL
jgi:hypothetical protein